MPASPGPARDARSSRRNEVATILLSSLTTWTRGIRSRGRSVGRGARPRDSARSSVRGTIPSLGGRVVCVTSGKGGTGKSVFTTSVAVDLAKAGRSVALVDADLGLANAHLLLDVTPERHLLHLLAPEATIEDVTVEGPAGIRLLSGGSGIHEIASLDRERLFLLIRKLERLRKESDFLLFDTSAGIGPQTMMFLFASREIILVTTTDLTSLTDGYAIIKTLSRRSPESRVSVVVNRVRTEAEARRAFRRLEAASARFLGARLGFLGYLHEDPAVRAAPVRKKTVVEAFPSGPFARGIRVITRRLLEGSVASVELPRAVRGVVPREELDPARLRARGNGRSGNGTVRNRRIPSAGSRPANGNGGWRP